MTIGRSPVVMTETESPLWRPSTSACDVCTCRWRMATIAPLYGQGKMAVIANSGTLVRPIKDRNEYRTVAGVRPPTCMIPEAEVFLGEIGMAEYQTPGTPANAKAVVC